MTLKRRTHTEINQSEYFANENLWQKKIGYHGRELITIQIRVEEKDVEETSEKVKLRSSLKVKNSVSVW